VFSFFFSDRVEEGVMVVHGGKKTRRQSEKVGEVVSRKKYIEGGKPKQQKGIKNGAKVASREQPKEEQGKERRR